MLNLKLFFVRRPSCASQPSLPYCMILRSWPPKKPILLLALFLAPDMAARSGWTTFFLVFFFFFLISSGGLVCRIRFSIVPSFRPYFIIFFLSLRISADHAGWTGVLNMVCPSLLSELLCCGSSIL